MTMVLFVIVAFAILADGMASGVAFQGFLQANNIFSYILVYGTGFIVTGIVALSGWIWKNGTPWLLKILWFLSVIVDVYTTYVATIFYVLLKNPLSVAPNIEDIPNFSALLGMGTNQQVQVVLVIILPIIISGTTMLSEYTIEKNS